MGILRGKRNCVYCAKEFTGGKHTRKFCNNSCHSKHMYANPKEVQCKCEVCGTAFVNKHRIKRTCSHKCYIRRWDKENKESRRLSKKKYKESPRGKEILSQWTEKWAATPHAQNIRYNITRRRLARKANAPGNGFTKKEFKSLCRKLNCRCLKCTEIFPIEKLTADHIVPLFVGGSDSIENIQPLCRSCNSSKGTKTINYLEPFMTGFEFL